jgi:hypothetical protein
MEGIYFDVSGKLWFLGFDTTTPRPEVSIGNDIINRLQDNHIKDLWM